MLIKNYNINIFIILFLTSHVTYCGKLAIVIDDCGYRPKIENQILNLPIDISIAVLPDSPYASKMAIKAHKQGREILIHMPMAPLKVQPMEQNTLMPAMSRNQIADIIQQATKKVPYAVGLNNHMGSAMTSNLNSMQHLMHVLSHYSYYFLDSLTISNSQAIRAALNAGVRVLKRQVFLDHSINESDIFHQFNHAILLARRNGFTIAIGHPHPTTVRVLQRMISVLPEDIILVRPSMLLN